MEKELNIAAILKDKPLDIKLWTDIFGEVTLDYVSKNGNGFNVKHHHSVLDKFLPNGKIYEEGALCIYPSKSMRDWSKFAWKKGDVLATDINTYCIFDSWENDAYTQFRAKYICRSSDCHFYSDEVKPTCDWTRVKENDIIEYYINIIERSKGGKLNLKTLEIEKPQFKDGDIVVLDDDGKSHFKTILLYQSNIDDKYEVYSFLNAGTLYLSLEATLMDDRKARPATDSEKQQLFAALEKKGKTWDAEKKAIVDLPKKCEFKALDYILVRDKGHVLPMWQLYQYAHENENYIYVVGSLYGLDRERIEFIPYNEETAHLLGTTDDWKGGNND